MVKGISRQAILVRPPENGPFEQAIFLLAEERGPGALSSPEELLALAEQLAAQYSLSPPRLKGLKGRPAPAWLLPVLSFLAGALCAVGVMMAGAAW